MCVVELALDLSCQSAASVCQTLPVRQRRPARVELTFAEYAAAGLAKAGGAVIDGRCGDGRKRALGCPAGRPKAVALLSMAITNERRALVQTRADMRLSLIWKRLFRLVADSACFPAHHSWSCL
jgi:hypothetical protein